MEVKEMDQVAQQKKRTVVWLLGWLAYLPPFVFMPFPQPLQTAHKNIKD